MPCASFSIPKHTWDAFHAPEGIADELVGQDFEIFTGWYALITDVHIDLEIVTVRFYMPWWKYNLFLMMMKFTHHLKLE